MLSTLKSAPTLARWHPELNQVSGAVARHCDRAEHVEQYSREHLVDAARRLRGMAVEMAGELGVDLRESYTARIADREARHVLGGPPAELAARGVGVHPSLRRFVFDGAAAIRAASTWREWQQAQQLHDMTYLPDVAGMPRRDQVAHIGHHLAKLDALMRDAVDLDEARPAFVRDRLPDLMLFGLKLATVVNDPLPWEPLPV